MESQRSSEAHRGELVGFPTDDLERKLVAALATLRAANVPIDGKRVDHACYRSATKDEYFAAKRAAEAGGATLLVESMIGGRPIATYALARPISTHAIALLEPPAPKPGRPYATGWEHAEIALGDDLEATVSFAAAPAPYLLLVADADAGAGGYRQLSHDGYRLTCCVRPRSAPPTSQ